MATIPKYVLESIRKATRYNRLAVQNRCVVLNFLEKLNLHEDENFIALFNEWADDERDEFSEWFISELASLIKLKIK